MTFADTKQFITVWYEAADQAEVCRRLEMDRRDVSNRAAQLRRKGIVLKDLPGKKAGTNGQKLAAEEWQELARWALACKAAKAMAQYRQGGRS